MGATSLGSWTFWKQNRGFAPISLHTERGEDCTAIILLLVFLMSTQEKELKHIQKENKHTHTQNCHSDCFWVVRLWKEYSFSYISRTPYLLYVCTYTCVHLFIYTKTMHLKLRKTMKLILQ